MDGITDCAYRVICKQVFEQYGHPNDQLMLWTEFMSADGYCHNPPGVIKHLLKTDYEPELIAQIFGGEGDTLLSCAVDIEAKYNFAGIELNMGCPSPKIMRCAAGS
jgi:tRNA-dihydrouridine synthase